VTTARVTPRPTGACTAYRWTPKTGNRTVVGRLRAGLLPDDVVGVPIRPVRIGLAGPLLVLAVRGRHALAALAVPVAECHARALANETPDRRLADPRCSARHRCNLAVEPTHVRHLSLHCETRIHDTPYPSGGHRLVGPAWVSDPNRLRKLQASAFGTFRWADSLRLGSNCAAPAGVVV
jgi:hypothetical protein